VKSHTSPLAQALLNSPPKPPAQRVTRFTVTWKANDSKRWILTLKIGSAPCKSFTVPLSYGPDQYDYAKGEGEKVCGMTLEDAIEILCPF